MYPSLERTVVVAALLAVACVVGMLAIFVVTGVGQDPLQFIHPADEYARILVARPAALRACLGLDNLFIVFYTTVFAALALLLVGAGAPRALVALSTALLVGLALLDMLENFHFLAMLARAELGLLPSGREIELQVIESLFKFHVSYLGLFLLGLTLSRAHATERALAALSWYVQLPVGVAIYVAPRALATPLVFVRFAYFVSALVLVAVRFGARAQVGSGARA